MLRIRVRENDDADFVGGEDENLGGEPWDGATVLDVLPRLSQSQNGRNLRYIRDLTSCPW